MSAEQEEFIDTADVADVIPDDDLPEPVDNDVSNEADPGPENPEDPDDDVLEIDMSNNLVAYFDKHTDLVFMLATHPTLPLILSGAGDDKAYLWTLHLRPPKLVSTFSEHSELVIAGGFSADGNYCVTADMNGKVVVHRLTKRGQVWTFVGEVESVSEVVWLEMHPKEPIFAYGAIDGSVWVHQLGETIDMLMSGFVHQTECTSGRFVEIDSGLALVTCSEDGLIVQWNGYTGEAVFKFGLRDFKGTLPPWVSIAASDADHVAAIGSRDGKLAIFNTLNGHMIDVVTAIELQPGQDVAEASIEAIGWSPQLLVLAVGLVSGDLLFFDSKTWRLRRLVKLNDAITKVRFVSAWELVVGCMDGRVYVVDCREGKELFVGMGHNMGVLDFVVDVGGRLVTAGDDGVCLIFEKSD